jgi:hypothetical protein
VPSCDLVIAYGGFAVGVHSLTLWHTRLRPGSSLSRSRCLTPKWQTGSTYREFSMIYYVLDNLTLSPRRKTRVKRQNRVIDLYPCFVTLLFKSWPRSAKSRTLILHMYQMKTMGTATATKDGDRVTEITTSNTLRQANLLLVISDPLLFSNRYPSLPFRITHHAF